MAITLDGTTGITTPDVDTDGLTVDTNTLFVDAANNRVGVGTSSPADKLTIVGGNIINPNSSGSEITSATVGIGQNIHLQERQPNGAFSDRTDLAFVTNTGFGLGESEKMRLDAGGNLLVGTTSTAGSAKMMVQGSVANNIVRFINTNASPFGPLIQYPAGVDPNGTSNEFIDCRGNATTPRFQVRSNGGVANFSANNVNLSDERVKTNIAPVGPYWDKIKALQVVTYKYLDQTHDDDNIGVIAQQVESVAPELVSNDGFGETPEDGVPLKSIYEADLHYATLKALQEAMARIEALEARISALETSA